MSLAVAAVERRGSAAGSAGALRDVPIPGRPWPMTRSARINIEAGEPLWTWCPSWVPCQQTTKESHVAQAALLLDDLEETVHPMSADFHQIASDAPIWWIPFAAGAAGIVVVIIIIP
jgi:hypothetical protein